MHFVQGLSYKNRSELLFMCEKSVQRYLALYKSTGSVSPHQQKFGPTKLI